MNKILSNLLLQQNVSMTKKLDVHRECTPDEEVLEKVDSSNFFQVKRPYLHMYLILI